ncbi:PLD nuclease N-terminal domain-containing protein [Leucobacter chromiireducens]|uniref:PLDc_N domain-containing protein n=1 Tax=Leucobacter chromiireducens subsp. chromiireducens TaxID=660067 RepID=A0ABS1SME4_9MICO|nr:PLD nuclease N-terminal domain-containing protein [Leucobacter chromiireducens]MBL3689341.1 PLDc_N domain-containing protein [Leucobacter chromiireducens subsp. chromiireducens]
MTTLSALTELAVVPAAVMSETPSPNPLLPTGYDIAFSAIAVAFLSLAVWALVLLVKRQDEVSLTEFFLWIAVILMFPFFGAGVYLLARGRRRREAPAQQAEPALAEPTTSAQG